MPAARLAAARAGDPDAVMEVVRRCTDPVHAACHRLLRGSSDVSDVVQDTMVRIVQALPGFDGRSAVTTWATRIAINAALGHLRREKYRRHASIDAGPGGAGAGLAAGATRESTDHRELGEPGGSRRIERLEAAHEVRESFDELDPEARALLLLRDIRGLEYEQIADVLGVPLGTVKSRIFRARAALRERVESRQPPDDD
ncbi:MAG: sigma-70 family RNA polymerase sigma factor [Phycisphaerales bacterium]